MYILGKKAQKLKNVLFLHFMTTFHALALKVKPSEVKLSFSPFRTLEMSIIFAWMFGLFILK